MEDTTAIFLLQKCSSALLGCLDVESQASKEIEKTLAEPKSKAPSMKITTEYLPMKLKNRIGTVDPVTIEEFAEANFKVCLNWKL